ncbi:DUF5317 family protein [Fusibacter sp. 3D3]|uniref:DUF5317 family protein n=1 Tax=Fusibacter sp. 3D3 TaxID=1048380 RepID=UPI0008531306|nr:DUF5317 family protein [Fusibacter sp. 3D3]GAU75639.1 hypothetical protein F3D3_0230 [Fusibacter sp. 3D3]
MYLEAILLGLLIGFIRNGSLQNFINARFKGWLFMPIAFILFLMPYFSMIFNFEIPNENLYPFSAIVVCSLILLMNFGKRGMKLILLGTLLNIIIMAINQFQMPLVYDQAVATGLETFSNSVKQGDIINYIMVSSENVINVILGKHVLLPEAYPLNRILSLGDIVISLGIVFLIQEEMHYHVSKLRGTMVNFSYQGRNRR